MGAKTKINMGLAIILLITAFIIIIIGIEYHNEIQMQNEGPVTDSAVLPVQPVRTAVDSLPHYRYQLIADSLQHIAENEKNKNTLHPHGFPANTGFIGFVSTFRSWYGWYTDDKSHLVTDHFVFLPDYAIADGYKSVYRNGSFYLQTPYGKKVKTDVGYLPQNHMLLFPVSEKTFGIGYIFLLIFMALIIFCLMYILIALPVNVLINISKGKVFTAINIRDLHIIAYTSLAVFLIEMILPYIIHLFLLNTIQREFSISFSSLWSAEWVNGLIGIITLLIAKAFKKGYRLQQENDLTI